MPPLGYPLDTDEPAIRVTPGPAPYQTLAEVNAQFRPLGQPDHDREARVFSENVARARADEEKRREMSRLHQHEQHIAHLRASGVSVSTAEEERLHIIALGK